MGTITISPKFQVVIPKAIREELGLLPGQKVQAIAYGERLAGRQEQFVPRMEVLRELVILIAWIERLTVPSGIHAGQPFRVRQVLHLDRGQSLDRG